MIIRIVLVTICILQASSFATAQVENPSSGFDFTITKRIDEGAKTFNLTINNNESHPVFCERILIQVVRALEHEANCGHNQEDVDIVFRDIMMDGNDAFRKASYGEADDRFYCQINRPLYSGCRRGCSSTHGERGGKCFPYCEYWGRRYLAGDGFIVWRTICETSTYTCKGDGSWEKVSHFRRPPRGQICP